MVKKTVLTAFAAVSVMLPGLVLADVDSFGEARMGVIEVAFERALMDPETDVDRLSPARLYVMVKAYESHPATRLVDELSHARWVAVQAAYDTLDRGFDEIALAN